MPTCSIPIAAQLSSTVCRHMTPMETSWWMPPELSITKWAQVLGSSCSSGSGMSGANVLYVAWKLGVSV